MTLALAEAALNIKNVVGNNGVLECLIWIFTDSRFLGLETILIK